MRSDLIIYFKPLHHTTQLPYYKPYHSISSHGGISGKTELWGRKVEHIVRETRWLNQLWMLSSDMRICEV